MFWVRGEGLAEVGLEGAQVADRTGRDDLTSAHHVRQESCPHRLHHNEIAVRGLVDDRSRSIRRHREWLLEQHVFACPQRQKCMLGVKWVGTRDINCADAEVIAERLIARVSLGYAELVGEGPRRRLTARSDRDYLVTVMKQVVHEELRDEARAEYAPPSAHARDYFVRTAAR